MAVTLVVEDGSLVSEANAYISLADASAYCAQHVHTEAWDAASDDQRETALIEGTRWLDATCTWAGLPVSSTQSLGWPRTGVYTRDGVAVSSTVVPTQVGWATVEFALSQLAENRTLSADRGALTSLTVGPVSETYAGGGSARTILPFIARVLVGQFLRPTRVLRA